MTAHEPPNPYSAGTAALTDEEANETKATATAGKPSRLGAVVLSVLAYPLMGTGLYLLRRPRRFAVWASIGFALLALSVIGVRAAIPKLGAFAMVGMLVTLLWSVGDSLLVRVGPARPALRAWVFVLAVIGAGKGSAFVVRQWLIEAFQMPSGSMVPTLLVGDHMFVKKGSSGITRGDAIVFKFPQDHSTDYIKRVIAVGGDTIEVRQGVPSINGIPLAHEAIDEPCSYKDESAPAAEAESCALVRETNAGRSYTIMLSVDHPAMDQPATRIADGEVFVMGDNRDNSYDSRKWGTVNIDLIKGKATLIWWSRGPSGVRWSRVGRGID